VMELEQGAWVFQDAAVSAPVQSLHVAAGAHLNVSGTTRNVDMHAAGELRVYGSITGDIDAPWTFEGNGAISGAVHHLDGLLRPVTGGTLHIGDELVIGSDIDWASSGPAAGTQYPQIQVDGGLSILPGAIFSPGSGLGNGFEAGQSYVVILNGGNAPIAGTFHDLPEGTRILLPGHTLALKVSYQMNGDGQALGNDFGFTVVTNNPLASNRTLSVAGPVAARFGEEIVLTYTLGNEGPATSTVGTFEGIVPSGATFLGSTPEGELNAAQQTLTIPLADMPMGGNATVVMRFQAGNQRGALLTGGMFVGTSEDPDGMDPTVSRAVAYLPGGQLLLSGLSHDHEESSLGLSVESIVGVRYRVESSVNLLQWETVEEFVGNGEVMTREMPTDQKREFFRIRIVP